MNVGASNPGIICDHIRFVVIIIYLHHLTFRDKELRPFECEGLNSHRTLLITSNVCGQFLCSYTVAVLENFGLPIWYF
jgi:hypothetical protein